MKAELRANDKEKVREHYDRMSPYYHSLWGEHIHHGYWIRGDESKETAQVQLIAPGGGGGNSARREDSRCGLWVWGQQHLFGAAVCGGSHGGHHFASPIGNGQQSGDGGRR